MNISMWEDLKHKIEIYYLSSHGDVMIKSNILVMMETIEKENNVMVELEITENLIKFMDIDGIVCIEMIFPENETVICNVYYDTKSDELKDHHWKIILEKASKDIDREIDIVVDYNFRRSQALSTSGHRMVF